MRMNTFFRFARCTRGATAIEYALIGLFVSLMAVTAFAALSGSLSSGIFLSISNILQ